MIAFAESFPMPRPCRRVVMPLILAHHATSLLEQWTAAKAAAHYQPLTAAELADVAAAMALAEQVRQQAERQEHARRQQLRAAHVAAAARRRRGPAPRPTSLLRLALAACRRALAWLAAPIV